MTLAGMKLLMISQVALEIIILIFFVVIVYRLRRENRKELMDHRLRTYQALLADADKMTRQFDRQLAEKKRLIKTLNTKLEEKAVNMSVLLNRAESIGATAMIHTDHAGEPRVLSRRERDVMRLAAKGHGPQDIAGALSIPKEEVKLVLKLQQKVAAMDP